LEIVEAAARMTGQRYPNSEFHVLLWDVYGEHTTFRTMYERLKARVAGVHLISELLPGFVEDPSRYEIAYDGHPNALTHHLIAEYVVRHIAGGG
jgi:hypothetical protein